MGHDPTSAARDRADHPRLKCVPPVNRPPGHHVLDHGLRGFLEWTLHERRLSDPSGSAPGLGEEPGPVRGGDEHHVGGERLAGLPRRRLAVNASVHEIGEGPRSLCQGFQDDRRGQTEHPGEPRRGAEGGDGSCRGVVRHDEGTHRAHGVAELEYEIRVFRGCPGHRPSVDVGQLLGVARTRDLDAGEGFQHGQRSREAFRQGPDAGQDALVGPLCGAHILGGLGGTGRRWELRLGDLAPGQARRAVDGESARRRQGFGSGRLGAQKRPRNAWRRRRLDGRGRRARHSDRRGDGRREARDRRRSRDRRERAGGGSPRRRRHDLCLGRHRRDR